VVDDGWMNARDAAVVLSFGGLGLFLCGRFLFVPTRRAQAVMRA